MLSRFRQSQLALIIMTRVVIYALSPVNQKLLMSTTPKQLTLRNTLSPYLAPFPRAYLRRSYDLPTPGLLTRKVTPFGTII